MIVQALAFYMFAAVAVASGVYGRRVCPATRCIPCCS